MDVLRPLLQRPFIRRSGTVRIRGIVKQLTDRLAPRYPHVPLAIIAFALWGCVLMTLGEWAAVIVTLIVGLPGLYWARHEALESREQHRLTRLDLENRGVDTISVAHGDHA